MKAKNLYFLSISKIFTIFLYLLRNIEFNNFSMKIHNCANQQLIFMLVSPAPENRESKRDTYRERKLVAMRKNRDGKITKYRTKNIEKRDDL